MFDSATLTNFIEFAHNSYQGLAIMRLHYLNMPLEESKNHQQIKCVKLMVHLCTLMPSNSQHASNN
jgi:hypothetical protein